jgi:glycerol uptake facilitator-like aquaporin
MICVTMCWGAGVGMTCLVFARNLTICSLSPKVCVVLALQRSTQWAFALQGMGLL